MVSTIRKKIMAASMVKLPLSYLYLSNDHHLHIWHEKSVYGVGVGAKSSISPTLGAVSIKLLITLVT